LQREYVGFVEKVCADGHGKSGLSVSDARQMLDRAEMLLGRKAYEDAHRLCLAVLQADPGAARAWFLLGVLTADHENFAKAAELLDRACGLGPEVARHHAHLARVMVALNRRPEALAAAARAADLAPADALTLDTLGVVFTRLGQHVEALPFFERATAAETGNASFLYNLAASRQFAGDFPGAEVAYAAALAIEPGLHRAWSSRVQLARQTPERNFAPQLERLFAEPSADPDRALHLGHALAKTWEDLGEPVIALDWLLKAKAAKRRVVRYSPQDDIRLSSWVGRAAPRPWSTASSRVILR
jgi:tetratricopeptide (TPR) repeat protein